MKSITLACCLSLMFYQRSSAQTFMSISGRTSLIAVPEVTGLEGGVPFGFGGALKVDWINTWQRNRCLEFSYDLFNLSELVSSNNGGNLYTLDYNPYVMHAISASYGFRSYLSDSNSGLYLDGMFGILITDVEGSTDKIANNVIGITGQITPCVGFNKYGFDLSMMAHVAPARGSVLLWPTASLGIHIPTTGKRAEPAQK